MEGVPNTITFPYGSYKLGSGPITRHRIVNGLRIQTDVLSGAGTSDSFVADGAEVVLYFFPAGSVALASQTFSVGFKPASVGATQTALRVSYVCNPTTFASNLDQQATRTVFTSATSIDLMKTPGMPLCYDYQYLDNSNNPVGGRSNVQVLP